MRHSLIEDQVTNNAARPVAAAHQVPRQDAILDFIVTHGLQQGVVDVTSSGQAGHVRDKSYNEGPFAFIWESIYPSIDFANLAAPPVLAPALAAAVQASIRQRANAKMGGMLLTVKSNLELFEQGIMHGNGHFPAARLQARNDINGLPNAVWTPIQVGVVDVSIAAANALLPGYAAQPLLSAIIGWVRGRYNLLGNPHW